MLKKILIAILFMSVFGCAKCTLVHSEYYDITGKVFVPKPSKSDVVIYEEGKVPDLPYFEIGAIKVMARFGVSRSALNNELKRRAGGAGADAVIDVRYTEDKTNEIALCGKLFSTRRNITVTGRAIIFQSTTAGGEK